MKNMLIITCALLVGAQMESSVHTVKGHIGGKAVIECPYPPGCEHRQKYVCRGDCPPGNKDIPVQTAVSQVWAKTGRFSLHDNATARVFTVTITGLTAKDSGKYWCAVQFPWYNSDLYTELRIDIGPAPVTTLSPAIITGASTVLTFSPVSVVCSVAVVIVVLLSMLGVLIYFRKAKHKRTETTDAVFLYTSGCSSSHIYLETGGSAVEMGHSVPTVIQQHQNPITITSTTTSFSTTTSSPTSSSITTTSSPISSSITTTSSPTSYSSSSTVPSAPPQVYEVPESLYQRMAPLVCGKIPVPRDSSPSARTADGAEYMSMQDCARAADGAEYT
ncbi:hypothetical protein AALO_G00094690 [Alosa alosa]|uniref:Immunoglobulin V-set domain-containing protein n=1 Tax=Alosa alosa TaxID=278164 RepID=A0AAV6GSX6_9TELE|nr:protein CD300H-like [Alosa alosa]KAG5278055.1 hypothetical protein AALO_G00094690 [Alosa alosa]